MLCSVMCIFFFIQLIFFHISFQTLWNNWCKSFCHSFVNLASRISVLFVWSVVHKYIFLMAEHIWEFIFLVSEKGPHLLGGFSCILMATAFDLFVFNLVFKCMWKILSSILTRINSIMRFLSIAKFFIP